MTRQLDGIGVGCRAEVSDPRKYLVRGAGIVAEVVGVQRVVVAILHIDF